MRKKVIVYLCLVVMASGATADGLAVVSPQGPLPSVVTTDIKTDKDAAADLCNYLSRVSSRKITVATTAADEGMVIHVGRDPFVNKNAPEIDKLFADGYIVKSIQSGGRHHLILAGKDDPSSQWAVEQFLKDYCGVRWLFPDPKYGEVVPSRPTIKIASTLSKTYEPDYRSRTNVGMYYFNPGGTYLRLRPRGFSYGGHAIQNIFSMADFEAHPEWFPYINGKRMPAMTYRQICTTNPETVKHAVEYSLEYLRKNPNEHVTSIGMNDGAGWCECTRCKKFLNTQGTDEWLASIPPPYTISERWWHWVNQVAREVAKTQPDKWVEALSYGSTSRPPRFVLEPKVAVTKTFVVTRELKQAEQWTKVCKSVNLYSYMFGRHFLGFRHYPHAARDFLKWGHDKLGAQAHITEGQGDWTFDGPKYHYLQALQWDVNADPDEIMRDFCDASYARAAVPMRAFWDRLEAVYERRQPVHEGTENRRFLFYQWGSGAMATYMQPNDEFREYTSEDVKFLDRCIEKATSLAAADTEGVQFRMERISDAWKHYRTMVFSKVEYYDHPPTTEVDSEEEKQAALKLAGEISDLRQARARYYEKLGVYGLINPRIAKPYPYIYYATSGSALTFFSHERNILDELCSSVSRYITKSAGTESAVKFWQQFAAADTLYGSAQTQLYMLSHPKLPNLLVNGDFESGDLNGWDISGTIHVVRGSAAHGGECSAGTYEKSYQVTISQRLPASPQERYRLTAWGRYLTEPPEWAVALEGVIEFYTGSKRVWTEPTRSTVRTISPAAGWVRLRSTATVPPGADSVVIKLKKSFSTATVRWDDVTLQKIKGGIKVEPGVMADAFGGESLDPSNWSRATGSAGYGTIPPRVADGFLVYDDTDMYPLISLASFDELLKYKGKNRYRLRLHARSPSAGSKPSAFSWGIKTGTGVISMNKSGMWWTHRFGSDKIPKAQLVTYAHQRSKSTQGAVLRLKNLDHPLLEIWYTFYFDPEYVTVYASADGFDESRNSLVAEYKHGIKNITAEGSVYLKLDRGQYLIDEISLRRPRKPAEKPD